MTSVVETVRATPVDGGSSSAVAFAAVAVGELITISITMYDDSASTPNFTLAQLTKTAGSATITEMQLDNVVQPFESSGVVGDGNFLGFAQYSCRVTGAGDLTLTHNIGAATWFYFMSGRRVAPSAGKVWDATRVPASNGTNQSSTNVDNLTAVDSGNVTVTGTGFISVLLAPYGSGGAFTMNEDSQFTVDATEGNLSSHMGGEAAYRIATATLTDSGSWTIGGTNGGHAVGAVAYQEVASGGGGGGGATISAAQAGGAAAGALGTPSNIDTPVTAVLGCTTSVSASGTLKAVLSTTQSLITGITGDQIIAGTTNAGAAAAFVGSNAVAGTAPSLTIAGLARDTVYHGAMVIDDGTDSNVLTFSFRTAEPVVSLTNIKAPNSSSNVADVTGANYCVFSAFPGAAPTVVAYGTLNIVGGAALVPCGNSAVAANVEVLIGWTVGSDHYRAGGLFPVTNNN